MNRVFFYALVFCSTSIVHLTTTFADQAEGTIAVNPTNPKNIVGALINGLGPYSIGCYFSTDGGTNWTGTDNISGNESAGDPVTAFNPIGVAYLLYQIRNDHTNNTAGLYLHRSTDGGANWSSRITVFSAVTATKR